VERAGWRVVVMSCLGLWLDIAKWKVKKKLVNSHADKFYPHSILTLWLQLSTTYEYEIVKFAKLWCDSEPTTLINSIKAIKEIFETENQDDMVSLIERLANKYM
jgi:hypothetical protein